MSEHHQKPNKPKILLITRNLPPLVGGMERLNWHMANELSLYFEVKIVGPEGSEATRPKRAKLNEVPLKPLPLFLLAAFYKALCLAWRWKPDMILAGSGLTAPLAWLVGKLSGAHSSVYLHGFDITAPSRIYQKLWTPIFKKMDRVIVNSTPTKQLALTADVPEDRIHLVYPGVDLPKSPQPPAHISEFRRTHGLEGKRVLISVGRLTTRKGLREFVKCALPKIVQEEPQAILLIVGEEPKNSLGAGTQTVDSIRKQAKKSGMEKHILFLGVIIDKNELATAYEASDVHVFPVRHIPDDPEGFGMVAIEAAAHGLSTVAFATGGVVDAVCHGTSGYLAEQNNYGEFSKCVLKTLRRPDLMKGQRDFAERFAWKNFGESMNLALGFSKGVK